MRTKPVLWLRIAYWTGAIVDIAAGLMMVFPGLLAFMYRPVDFQPGPDYRYAMGIQLREEILENRKAGQK